jgi:hypothetical protein
MSDLSVDGSLERDFRSVTSPITLMRRPVLRLVSSPYTHQEPCLLFQTTHPDPEMSCRWCSSQSRKQQGCPMTSDTVCGTPNEKAGPWFRKYQELQDEKSIAFSPALGLSVAAYCEAALAF